MDAGDAFAPAHEVKDRVALLVVLEGQARGVVEQDRVILLEVGLVEHRVLVGQVGSECTSLFA